MADGGRSASLADASDAVACADWPTAFELLASADADAPLGPEHLPLLAEAAYGAGDLDVTIDAWERLYVACSDSGDSLSAAGAAVRVAMHLMMDTGLMAPVRGWLSRTERLLDGHDETPVHAYLAMVRTYERMLSGDVDATRRWARRTIEVGERQGEPAPVAVGRIALARTLIFEGEIDAGLALLDDAAVSTVSGELDALSVGMVYCELVCAMQGLAQYDRAAEWTEAMARWSRSEGIGSLHGRCRVHRAELLRIRGDFVEAEHEARQACAELRPWMRREFGWPLTELGTIRLRRGDLAGADEAFEAARDCGWDPQPGLALLHLARGHTADAVREIRHALAHPIAVPSKERPPNQDLCRAPLLEAAVQIASATGDSEWAKAAADDLSGIAARFRSRALEASAALAQARAELLEGSPREAITCFERAVALWSEVGAPWEAAIARMGLADALGVAGDDDGAQRELETARAALEEIGARKASEAFMTRSQWRRAAGVHGRSERPGIFRRDGDVWTLVLEDEKALVRDLKGMHYIARLLAEPGREFHVLDMVAAEHRPSPDRSNDPELRPRLDDRLGPLLDEQAKRSYRRRLAEIDEDIEEARSVGDADRLAMAQNERDFLLRELSRAVGLGGRDRPIGSTSERARASVTRAIRYSLQRVGEHNSEIAAHLDDAVRTGTWCAYEPDPNGHVHWEL